MCGPTGGGAKLSGFELDGAYVNSVEVYAGGEAAEPVLPEPDGAVYALDGKA